MIPNKFTLGALDFKVIIVDDIDNTGLGMTCNALGEIKLSKNFYGKEMNQNSIDRTFYHELVHAILDELGYTEFSKNETFVDSFSAMLYQFEQTKQ